MKRIVIIFILIVCSCSVMTEQELVDPSEMDRMPKVKSGISGPLSREDSLKRVFSFQTNKVAIMQNYVNFAEGEFRLSISREAARGLGIQESAYEKSIGDIHIINEYLNKHED